MINSNVRLAGWIALVKAGNIFLLGAGQDQLGSTIVVEVGDGCDLQINDVVSASSDAGLRAQRQIAIQDVEKSVSVCSDDLARSITIKVGEHATDQSRARIIIGDSCASGIESQNGADFRFDLILSK